MGSQYGASRQFTLFTEAAWRDDVRQAVVDSLSTIPQFDESQMDYQLTVDLDGNQRKRISVDLTYPFFTIVAWPGIPSQFDLNAHTEFRQFR